MKIPRVPHRWDLTPRAAIRLQLRLADQVRVEPLRKPVRLVAGVDLAFPTSEVCVAGAVVWDLEQRCVVEQQLAWRKVRFPYISGLLTFREAPAVLAVVRRLRCRPDLFMFDGQGQAHLRRFGLASHIGLLLDSPSVGCAKSRLCGTHAEPPDEPGRWSPLIFQQQTVGVVLRTRRAVKPLYISVGHRVTLEDCIAMTMRCVDRYRLPTPSRLAHMLVTRHRRDGSCAAAGH